MGETLELIKPRFPKKIILKIVRVILDGFETISLTNHSGREMTLVCANNRAKKTQHQLMDQYAKKDIRDFKTSVVKLD